VLPSNEGRGYVLRRLLRRAARHGRLLGYEKPFLYEVCDVVINENLSAYPELAEKREYIKKTIKTEEDSFSKTVEKGLELLNSYIKGGGIIGGDVVFKLHDTFGFPVDLTREILSENNLTFDEAKFKELMQIQKDTARANQAFKGGWGDGELLPETLSAVSGMTTAFVGYEALAADTKILAMIENGRLVDSCSKGDKVAILLEKTPFYAESGGQVGDTGWINDIIYVQDTKKIASGQTLLHCYVESATLQVGQEVRAYVDAARRMAICANHTAAHLLHASLRKVLGKHVGQAGSLVDNERCRFDFSHGQALTPEELGEVEYRINGFISDAFPVDTREMSIDEAKEIGALALFGEKYGDTVRVVNVLKFSTELCGGTHVKNTSEIGLFKIISEASVAAGVRRIEAVTGRNVLGLIEAKQNEINEANEKIKQLSSLHTKEVARLNAIIAELQAQNSEIEEVGEKNGIKLLVMKLSGANSDALRQAGDKLKSEKSAFAAILAGAENFYCVCDKEAVSKGMNAGNIVREVSAVTGGKGGGRPDSAMAGIGDVSKVDEAIEKFKST
jgi:alanyl-tRNA synthetase